MDFSTILTGIKANERNDAAEPALDDDGTSEIDDNYAYTEHLSSFVTNAIVSQFFNSLLCILGLFGNGLTITVLVRQGLRDTTNTLLSSIAVFDSIYLLSDVAHAVHRILVRIDPGTARDFERVHYSSMARIYNLSLFCSIFQVAVMAAERLTAVLTPFLVSRIFTPFRIRCSIGLSLLYSCAFSLPGYFIVDENKLRDEDELESDGLKVLFIIPNIFLYMLPMAAIFMCNIAIGVMLHLRRRNVLSQDSTSRSLKRQKEVKLFKRLLVVCCVACASFLPRIILAWMLFFNTQLGLIRNGYIRFIFSACFHIYASSNFIIYVTMSSKFAKAFKNLVFGRIDW